MFLNEYEVADLAAAIDPDETPNRARAALYLTRLVNWTNRNSDGWPYWAKPSRASQKLQALVSAAHGTEDDCTAAAVQQALTPVKAFLTRQGVTHEVILTSEHAARTGCNLSREDFHPDGDENCPDGGAPEEHPRRA